MPILFLHPNLVSSLTLAGVLLGVLLLTCGTMLILLAWSFIRPPRMTDGKAAWVLKRLSPGDLGLAFEEVAFDVRDDRTGQTIRIAGWWIPHPGANGRTVLLIHGYADAKVGAIAWAPAWHALGWNIVAIDLRAHGESGGVYCTGGYFEREDVSQVIDQLRARRPSETKRLAIFGASFGAAVAVATAATRDDIDAVVLDSPPPSFSIAAALHMQRVGAPGGLLRRLAIGLAQNLTAANYAEVAPVKLLPTLRCPVLLIAPQLDPLLDHGAAAAKLRDTLPPSGEYWSVPETGHLMAFPADPDEYIARLNRFLSEGEPRHTGLPAQNSSRRV
jgi:pimeloyl-ACP methyl ester carboxylesterase